MTAEEVLKSVEGMSWEDLATIHNGIVKMMTDSLSPQEIKEIREALAESEADIARGDVMTSEELRKQLGLS